MFANNPDVAFADIDLSVSPMIKGAEVGDPGSDGWPTIRYFTKETGAFGAAYKKLTTLPICRELGDDHTMIDYIEDYGNTVLCGLDGRNCNEKELKYAEKWKVKPVEEVESQLSRLNDMTSKPMKSDLREWAVRRSRILKKIVKTADKNESPVEAGEL